MNKRGQGLSVNAIVLIVLGVFILAILILGFTLGWGKIAPWISTNNIDTIVNSCATACSTHSQYDFCEVNRTVKDGTTPEFEASCNVLANATLTQYQKYGVAECSVITCPKKI